MHSFTSHASSFSYILSTERPQQVDILSLFFAGIGLHGYAAIYMWPHGYVALQLTTTWLCMHGNAAVWLWGYRASSCAASCSHSGALGVYL